MPAQYTRPRIHTNAVGDLTCVTPSGTVPDQPGPVMTYSWALPPVAREPATKNTSLKPLSIGMM